MPPDFRFFILTCRDSATDFRLPITEALGRDYETYYIWLKRQPELTYPDGRKITVGFFKLLWLLSGIERGHKINVYFNSTNTSFPFVTAFMKYYLPRGIWCLDMHDDLRYHDKGLKLLRTAIAIKVMQWTSDLIVHAAPTLKELFPRSQHLGNASHIQPMSHEKANPHDILILASLDDRFDFELMWQTAYKSPQLTFHIYGQISENNANVKSQLGALQAEAPNVRYYGPYKMDNLPEIFSRHAIMFAPYKVGIDLTRYIDPLRYYHGLNAGMNLITTAIPQAIFMQDYLTVIHNSDEAALALASGKAPHKPYERITWEQRAAQLVKILHGYLKISTH